jgi:hypothetical protein
MGCPGRGSMGTGCAGDRMTTAASRATMRYRERVKAAKALGLAPRSDPPPVHKPVDRPIIPGQELVERLQELSADESVSGQARVSAARAVLEVQGVLGRHATGQRDKDTSVPPSVLTREGLVRELARLRRSILPGTRLQAIDNTENASP